MKGIQYKDTFAVQGSELFKLLSDGKPAEAEKSYKATALREKELLARLPDNKPRNNNEQQP